MSKPTIKNLTETLAIAQAEIARLHDAVKAQASRAIMAEEELANLKDQLEEQEVRAANRASNTNPESWKGLSKKQLDWLKTEGCVFAKTASGFKLFLKGDAITYQGKVAAALKGKICKDCNTTWIYFS